MESNTTQIVLDSTHNTDSKASITKVAFEKWQKNLSDHAEYGKKYGSGENNKVYNSLHNTGLDGKEKTGAITEFKSGSDAITGEKITQLKSTLSTESKGTFTKATPFEALRQQSTKVFRPDSFTRFDSHSLQKILNPQNIQIALQAMDARQKADAAQLEAEKTDVQKQNEQMLEFAGQAMMAFFLLFRAGSKDINEGIKFYKSQTSEQRVDLSTMSNLEIGREMMDRYLDNIEKRGGEKQIVNSFKTDLAGSTETPDTKKVLELCQKLISPDDIELLKAGSKNLYRDMWQATLEETFKQSGIEAGKAKDMAEFICKKENVENFFGKGKELTQDQINGLESITGFDSQKNLEEAKQREEEERKKREEEERKRKAEEEAKQRQDKMMDSIGKGVINKLEQTGKGMLKTAKDSFATSKTQHDKKFTQAGQSIANTSQNIKDVEGQVKKLDTALAKANNLPKPDENLKGNSDVKKFTTSAKAEEAKQTAENAKKQADEKLTQAKLTVTKVDGRIEALKKRIEEQKTNIANQAKALETGLTADKDSLENAKADVTKAQAAFDNTTQTLEQIPQAITDLKAGTTILENATKTLQNIDERKAEGLEVDKIEELTNTMDELLKQRQTALDTLNNVNQQVWKADAELKATETGLEDIVKQEGQKKAEEELKGEQENEIKGLKDQLETAKQAFIGEKQGLLDKINTQENQNDKDKFKVEDLEEGINKLQKYAQPQIKPEGKIGDTVQNLNGETKDNLSNVTNKLKELQQTKAKAEQEAEKIAERKKEIARKVEALQIKLDEQKATLDKNQAAFIKAQIKQGMSNVEADEHLNNNYDQTNHQDKVTAMQADINAINEQTNVQNKTDIETTPLELDAIEGQIKEMEQTLGMLNFEESTCLKEQAQAEADIAAISGQQKELKTQLQKEKQEKDKEEKKAVEEKQKATEDFTKAANAKITNIDSNLAKLNQLKTQITEQRESVSNTSIKNTPLANNKDNLETAKTTSNNKLTEQFTVVEAEIQKLTAERKQSEKIKEDSSSLNTEQLKSQRDEMAKPFEAKVESMQANFDEAKGEFTKNAETIESRNTKEVEELKGMQNKLTTDINSFDKFKESKINENTEASNKITAIKDNIGQFKTEAEAIRPQSETTNKSYIDNVKQNPNTEVFKPVEKKPNDDNKTHLDNIDEAIARNKIDLQNAKQLAAEKTNKAVEVQGEINEKLTEFNAKIAELESAIIAKENEIAENKKSINGVALEEDKKQNADLKLDDKEFETTKTSLRDSNDHVNEKNTELSNIKGVDVSNVENLKSEIEKIQTNIKTLNETFEKTTQEAAAAIQNVKQLAANQKGLEWQKATVESEIQKEEALNKFELPEDLMKNIDANIKKVEEPVQVFDKDITFKITSGKQSSNATIKPESISEAYKQWNTNDKNQKKGSDNIDNTTLAGTSTDKIMENIEWKHGNGMSNIVKSKNSNISSCVAAPLVLIQAKATALEREGKLDSKNCKDQINDIVAKAFDNQKQFQNALISNGDDLIKQVKEASEQLSNKLKEKEIAKENLQEQKQKLIGIKEKVTNIATKSTQEEDKKKNAMTDLNAKLEKIEKAIKPNGVDNSQQQNNAQNNTKSRNNAPAQTHNPNVQTKPLSRNNPNNVKSQAHIPKVTEPFKDQVHQPPLGSYQSVANLQSGKSQGQAAGRG
jgi:hypothetical protein